MDEKTRPNKISRLVESKYADGFAIAYKILRRKDLAKDAVSEASFNLLKMDLERFKKISNLDKYFLRVVRNEAIRILKRENKFDPFTDKEQATEALDDLLRNKFNEVLFILLGILAQRNETYSKIIKLFYLQGYTHAEIAREMEITERNSRVRLNRALVAFREIINEFYPFDDPDALARQLTKKDKKHIKRYSLNKKIKTKDKDIGFDYFGPIPGPLVLLDEMRSIRREVDEGYQLLYAHFPQKDLKKLIMFYSNKLKEDLIKLIASGQITTALKKLQEVIKVHPNNSDVVFVGNFSKGKSTLINSMLEISTRSEEILNKNEEVQLSPSLNLENTDFYKKTSIFLIKRDIDGRHYEIDNNREGLSFTTNKSNSQFHINGHDEIPRNITPKWRSINRFIQLDMKGKENELNKSIHPYEEDRLPIVDYWVSTGQDINSFQDHPLKSFINFSNKENQDRALTRSSQNVFEKLIGRHFYGNRSYLQKTLRDHNHFNSRMNKEIIPTFSGGFSNIKANKIFQIGYSLKSKSPDNFIGFYLKEIEGELVASIHLYMEGNVELKTKWYFSRRTGKKSISFSIKKNQDHRLKDFKQNIFDRLLNKQNNDWNKKNGKPAPKKLPQGIRHLKNESVKEVIRKETTPTNLPECNLKFCLNPNPDFWKEVNKGDERERNTCRVYQTLNSKALKMMSTKYICDAMEKNDVEALDALINHLLVETEHFV